MELAALSHFQQTVKTEDDGTYEVVLPYLEIISILKKTRNYPIRRVFLQQNGS